MTLSLYRLVVADNANSYYGIKKIDKLKIAEHEGGIVRIFINFMASLFYKHSLTSKYNKTQGIFKWQNLKFEAFKQAIWIIYRRNDRKELLDEVSYLHDKGFMYRDINPLNIMKVEPSQENQKPNEFSYFRYIWIYAEEIDNHNQIIDRLIKEKFSQKVVPIQQQSKNKEVLNDYSKERMLNNLLKNELSDFTKKVMVQNQQKAPPLQKASLALELIITYIFNDYNKILLNPPLFQSEIFLYNSFVANDIPLF